MKKIIIAACAFYAVESCAMHPVAKNVAAGLLATSPVTLSGAYYYHKTTQDQIRKKQDNGVAVPEYPLGKVNVFKPFAEGVGYGITPVVNVLMLGVRGIGFASDGIDKLLGTYSDHGVFHRNKNAETDAMHVGFFGGASLYATIPYALSVLKKVK
jgi:hypothetical protein